MRRSARAGLGAALCFALLQLVATLTINAQELTTSATTYRVFVPGILVSPASSSNWSGEELVALAELNRQRQANGCAALQASKELQVAAVRHSEDMARSGTFSHTGSNGSNFSQRARDAGYRYTPTGETIGAGYTSSAAVVLGWMNSQGHRDILMNCANNDIGIGLHVNSGSPYRYYWTAVLGRR
jgi:uncharacterized protein YkwD